jgi:hypothetical protein
MFERMPDRPDWDEHEAEQSRMRHRNKRIQREYERLEYLADEQRDEADDY